MKILKLINTKNLMIGFNRRFAKPINDVIKFLPKDTPRSILIRVNNEMNNHNHWTNDFDIGGGRIISDGCHFIDLSIYSWK